VRTRIDDGPAGRGRDRLLAVPRPRRRGGAWSADLRVRERDCQPDHDLAAPGPARPVAAGATPIARRVERGKRGAGMSTAREMTTTATWAPGSAAFDVERIRKDFPILQQRVHGKPLVYLDNAA